MKVSYQKRDKSQMHKEQPKSGKTPKGPKPFEKKDNKVSKIVTNQNEGDVSVIGSNAGSLN